MSTLFVIPSVALMYFNSSFLLRIILQATFMVTAMAIEIS